MAKRVARVCAVETHLFVAAPTVATARCTQLGSPEVNLEFRIATVRRNCQKPWICSDIQADSGEPKTTLARHWVKLVADRLPSHSFIQYTDLRLSDQPSKVLTKAFFSSRVLTEFYVIVAISFQTDHQFVDPTSQHLFNSPSRHWVASGTLAPRGSLGGYFSGVILVHHVRVDLLPAQLWIVSSGFPMAKDPIDQDPRHRHQQRRAQMTTRRTLQKGRLLFKNLAIRLLNRPGNPKIVQQIGRNGDRLEQELSRCAQQRFASWSRCNATQGSTRKDLRIAQCLRSDSQTFWFEEVEGDGYNGNGSEGQRQGGAIDGG
ncbi:MAG: hypothetical protein J3Q66DRAFT_404711 [Benniella sp.]|nr:MAG: hypothetical protein J3Q66DRAFT_404711 [Benniella sp.]